MRSKFLDKEIIQILDDGIENARFYQLMRPVCHFFGFCSFTSSSDKEYWVECKVDEERYKVEEGYKITLRAIDDRFSYDHYYQSDFVSLMRSGHIINTTGKQVKIVHKKDIENIAGGAEIVTEYDELVLL